MTTTSPLLYDRGSKITYRAPNDELYDATIIGIIEHPNLSVPIYLLSDQRWVYHDQIELVE